MTNNENNLKKVAVVAGAGAGLGIALCQKLVSEGYAVAGLSRSAEPQPQLGINTWLLPVILPMHYQSKLQ